MAQAKQATGGWLWVGRYVTVIVVSLLLSEALGHMDLFEKTSVDGKLSAAHIVKFLGLAAALVTLWMLGRRTEITLGKQGGKWAVLQHLVLPAVSLLVAALAYSVALLLLKPFMGATLSSVFNWTFIAAILGCSCWLIVAVFRQSDSLTALLAGKRGKDE